MHNFGLRCSWDSAQNMHTQMVWGAVPLKSIRVNYTPSPWLDVLIGTAVNLDSWHTQRR